MQARRDWVRVHWRAWLEKSTCAPESWKRCCATREPRLAGNVAACWAALTESSQRFSREERTGSSTAYEIAPQVLFQLFRGIREEGLEHLGIYHSHPAGENVPSRSDIDQSYYPLQAYFILSPQPRSDLSDSRISDSRRGCGRIENCGGPVVACHGVLLPVAIDDRTINFADLIRGTFYEYF